MHTKAYSGTCYLYAWRFGMIQKDQRFMQEERAGLSLRRNYDPAPKGFLFVIVDFLNTPGVCMLRLGDQHL